ncbi:hypothetical protein MLC52_05290 [Sulfurimonas sp. NW15]|uniref:hypothetical protein n=1 Tax=Sulfurimonas sp. NW15 TaxID=2922729 RepID=UPI003DAA02C0
MAQVNNNSFDKPKQNPKQEDATEAFQSLATRSPDCLLNFQVPIISKNLYSLENDDINRTTVNHYAQVPPTTNKLYSTKAIPKHDYISKFFSDKMQISPDDKLGENNDGIYSSKLLRYLQDPELHTQNAMNLMLQQAANILNVA